MSDVKSRVSHVDIRFNVPHNDVIVHTHPFFISEIVGNLLDNAVKYTESGEVALSVAEDNGKAKIVVSDTGCGIAPKDRKHIFERFYRAPSASAKPSSGLGLATVYEIVVKLLKGKIDCRSEVGSGTIFTVTLPLATSQRNSAPRRAQDARSPVRFDRAGLHDAAKAALSDGPQIQSGVYQTTLQLQLITSTPPTPAIHSNSKLPHSQLLHS